MTEKGIKSAYEKGMNFRGKFKQLFEGEDHKIAVSGYCSPKYRNKMSLFHRLKGMFSTFNETDHSDSDEKEITKILEEKFNIEHPYDLTFNILEDPKCRKRVEEVLKENGGVGLMAKKADDLVNKHPHLEKYLNFFENKHQPLYMKLFYIADYLDRSEDNNLNLDENEQMLKRELSDFYRFVLEITASDPNLLTLFSSKIFTKILQEIEPLKSVKEAPKIIFFSAHDLTLSVILQILDFDISQFHTDFNTELDFVVFEKNDHLYVKFYYDDVEYEIKKCGKECTLDKFIDLINNFIFTDEELKDYCEGKLPVLSKKVFSDNTDL